MYYISFTIMLIPNYHLTDDCFCLRSYVASQVPTYELTWHHILEESSLHSCYYENLGFHWSCTIPCFLPEYNLSFLKRTLFCGYSCLLYNDTHFFLFCNPDIFVVFSGLKVLFSTLLYRMFSSFWSVGLTNLNFSLFM